MTDQKYIPLSVPSLRGNEWEYIKECLDTEWVSTAGKYAGLFEDKIAEYTGSRYAVATVNGTSALQISIQLAGVKSEDEVLVPTLTFIAPVHAILYQQAKPVFMDADRYFNLDVEKTIQFIQEDTEYINGVTRNKKTGRKIAAVIPVHIFGNAVWLDELVNLCEERNIAVIEDACEAVGTRYKSGTHSGRHAGTIGRFGCLSFNGNKIITTGGGGMILTGDPNLAEKANYLTTQAKDDPVRYIHNEIGYNYRLTNIQAAMGVAQLEQLPDLLASRKEIFTQYRDSVNMIPGLRMVEPPDYATNNHWISVVYIDPREFGSGREDLMFWLKTKGIETRPIWHLNHLQQHLKKYQAYQIEKAVELADHCLCLPSSSGMEESDLKRVIDCLSEN